MNYERIDREPESRPLNEKIQEAYMKVLNERKKIFVSAYFSGNVLKWRTEDNRMGSDPMKKTKDKKAITNHLEKVLGAPVELELIKEAISSGNPSVDWDETTTMKGKKGNLIGFWQDLAAYYDFDGTTWKYQNGKWVNMGSTDKFKKQLKAGKWRGKLIKE